MKRKTIAALAGALAFCGACKEGLSAPSQDALVAGSQQTIQTWVTGILGTDRGQGTATTNLLFPESMARNSLFMTGNEPRFVNEIIQTNVDPSDFIGGAGWTAGFQTARAADNLLTGSELSAIPAGDQNAIRGLVQTIKALDYIREVELRDSLGAPIQGNDPTKVDPWRTKQAVLTFAGAVLDSAYANLTAAGVDATMPLTLPGGYTVNGDYTTTANLALFNRGLRGEVDVMRAFDRQNACNTCFTSAIGFFNTALASFGATPTAKQLVQGPYYEFNAAAPESAPNPLADNHYYLTDNFVNSVQAGDLRASKIAAASSPSATVGGITLTQRLVVTDQTIASNITRPIPIRRNADFYLMRAQAEAESGNLAGATADVNAVRTVEGGLAPYATFASVGAARAAILYEMRYSLIMEGPFYLQALREYGALTKAYVTQPGMPNVQADPTHAGDPLQQALPIPLSEVAARNGNVTPVP